MKRHIRYFVLGTAMSLFLGASLFSCKYNLVPEPSVDTSGKKNAADYADAVLPPKSLSASHGGYRNITLKWTPVENAVRYQIFSAATPFDTFEKIVETPDAITEYEVDVPAGSNYYFCIRSVNYYETVSSESIKVSGSSLAIPIITEIKAADDAQSVELHWWMDNCSSETYEKDIQFVIKAYDSQKKEIPGSALVKEGDSRSAVISGLEPSTNYYFTVQAEMKDSEQKAEISDLTNKETTHSVVPKAPEEFKVTKGVSKTEVQLSWKLPSGADYYDSASHTYSMHPVMFSIQRKEFGKNDSFYKAIANIGITELSADKDLYAHPYKLDYSFDCDSESTSSENLKIDVSTATGNIDTDNTYPKYKPGTTLTYLDKTVINGKQYTYRVIALTDDTVKEFKADSAITEPLDGWLISIPEFRATATYVPEDAASFTEVNVNFDFEFTSFDFPYHYILTQTVIPFDRVAGEETVIEVYDSVSGVNGKTISFNVAELAAQDPDERNWEGAYKYKIYITDKSVFTIPSEEDCYAFIDASGSVAVTDDASKKPQINKFTVKDGYSSKYILSWDYNEDYSYIVSYIPYENGVPLPEVSEDVKPEELTITDGEATFNHAAVSGDVRTYSLTAANGLSVTKFFADEQEENIVCKTLGTAKPVMAEADYSTITVSWPAVQMADSYSVSAKYHDDTNVTYDDEAASWDGLLTENENYTLTTDLETGDVVCTITNIKGYNRPDISGLPIDFEVTAENTLDNTLSKGTVCNLGPALTFPKTGTTPQVDRLSFTWNKVDGAEKYLIYRVLYKNKDKTEIWDADKYIVTETSITNDSEVGDRANISYNPSKKQFTLTDIQKDAVDPYGYHLNQEKIQWGLPYGYVVLPLKEDGNKNTFDFDSKTFKCAVSSAVDYGTLAPFVTHTRGYGLNVTAAKSVSASAVDISWDAPNTAGLIPTVYKKPFIKGDNPEYGAIWEKVQTLPQGATSYSDKLSNDVISSAFVYAVQYEASSGSDMVSSYRKQLLSDMDTENSPTEPSNKGYLLTLKDFSAAYGGSGSKAGDEAYYQENVNWSNTWDYEERALGPDSFTIDLKNKNLSATKNWVTVASVSIDDNVQSITENTSHADTTVQKMASNNGITLKPAGLTAGSAASTTGLLHVLRDAKHYYSVNLKRGAITVRQAEDESIYAYRQISDEELCKCVSLIIADSLYKAGVPNRKTYTVSGSTGTFYLACSTGTTDANKIQWYFTKYENSFTNGASSGQNSSISSFLTLNSNTSSFDNKGIYGETLYYLPELEITITSDIDLPSYKGKIGFSAGGCDWSFISTPSNLRYYLKMSVNGKTVVDISNDKKAMYGFFPYDLGNKHESPDSSINTSLITYQSPWWN